MLKAMQLYWKESYTKRKSGQNNYRRHIVEHFLPITRKCPLLSLSSTYTICAYLKDLPIHPLSAIIFFINLRISDFQFQTLKFCLKFFNSYTSIFFIIIHIFFIYYLLYTGIFLSNNNKLVFKYKSCLHNVNLYFLIKNFCFG